MDDDGAAIRKVDEVALLAAAQQGDSHAFSEIYQKYAARLYRQILYPRLGQRAAAEDALSETFRSVLNNIEKFEDRGKGLWPWLARIAVNKANDQHRKKARSRAALANFQNLMTPLMATSESPSAVLESDEDGRVLKIRIDSVLNAINPRYRQAITLRLIEDRSREQCAQLMQVKIGTFDVLLLRALRAFRARWQDTESMDDASAQIQSPERGVMS